MRVLIVDDERAARIRLSRLVDELGVEIVGEASNGMSALTLAHERHPDVILLDVAMPEIDGFDVARHLRDPRPLIIFQTAYAEFAVKAFEHEALDYVVKPVSRDRLVQALDRAQRRLGVSSRSKWTPEELSQLGAAFGHAPARPARLLVRQGAGHKLVAVKSISRFTADGGLVFARTPDGSFATDYTLAELETRLTGTFVRTSRADLVSLAHVVGITSNGDGSASLSLSDAGQVHVSRRRAAAVRATLQR